ncbi:uncharacterized protein DUF4407 [Actinocorallia herbida]|uniref:Uncharacterized protein DUF4407 n=1 Tax=Actinocorallia herbida TaxID=58109 RepID=A0A3N1CYB2_9ACTN|nr:DUF4407 domain-containing protein [Actinocorallia herbida]ROO86245.1 uncharacterized protein DUF4407 [Actinocorallia herbida]
MENRDFLIRLSGARTEILAQCPAERARFQGVGGAILTTSVLAGLSMAFALTTAVGLSVVLAVPAAVLWGLAILSLDRWLVASIPGSGPRRLRIALPRLLLALLLGFVISTPLVLQIFHSEIDAQIVEIQQREAESFAKVQQEGEVGKEVATLRASVTELQSVIDSNGEKVSDPAQDPKLKALTAELAEQQGLKDDYYREWQCQLYGGDGCAKPGNGPLAVDSKANYDKAKNRVDDLTTQIEDRKQQLTSTDAEARESRLAAAKEELPGVRNRLGVALERQADLQEAFDAQNHANNGLLIRLQALNEVSGKDATLNVARLLLFLLFLVIECLPVAVKLMQKEGSYERFARLDDEKRIREARSAQSAPARAPVTGGPPSVAPTRVRRGGRVADGPGADLLDLWERGPRHEYASAPTVVPVEDARETEVVDTQADGDPWPESEPRQDRGIWGIRARPSDREEQDDGEARDLFAEEELAATGDRRAADSGGLRDGKAERPPQSGGHPVFELFPEDE